MTAAGQHPDTPGQAAMREAARLESARIYGQVLADTNQPHADTVAATEAELITRWETLANIDQRATRARGFLPTPKRVAIEQAIARGWDEARIAQVTGFDVAQIRAVRAGMNRAAS